MADDNTRRAVAAEEAAEAVRVLSRSVRPFPDDPEDVAAIIAMAILRAESRLHPPPLRCAIVPPCQSAANCPKTPHCLAPDDDGPPTTQLPLPYANR